MADRSLVTFLFTDIEGSTRLWENHPDEMDRALAAHDRLLRRTIEDGGGAVFKTVGDAFCATFETVSDAVSAATGAQLAIGEHDWPVPVTIRVRMAVHIGECSCRDDDYFGPTVNRVARLLATANGGQVVLSASAHSALGDAVPPGVWFRDLGEHHLKDLGQPESVVQVCREGMPDIDLPLRSTKPPRHNASAQLTSFVGRTAELREVRALLTSSRLVTVTGAGGCGKTRLVTRIADALIAESTDEVWIVELASVRDSALVGAALGDVLGVRLEGSGAPGDLVAALQDREMVLVLDNCEHVLESIATLVAVLLRRCPTLTVLATSRERLGVPGEAVYWLPSLSMPGPEIESPGDLLDFDAIRLFVDRVRQQDQRFTLDQDTASSVTEICRRLDGIPLALELAAARSGQLTLTEICERLDERFRLLADGARATLPRHQTLQSMIDWSYDLLTAAEQRTLTRCSVFAGTFDLSAADAVCTPADKPKADVLDEVSALCAKSLIERSVASGRTRFRLLESVRHYADIRLSTDPTEHVATHAAHCRHYLALAERTEQLLYGPRQQEGFDRLGVEIDNFRAAIAWAGEEPARAPLGLRLAGALTLLWFAHGRYREGLDQTQHLLAITPADEPARPKALWSAGMMGALLGEDVGETLLQEALGLARQTSDRSLAARSLDVLGLLAFFRNDLLAARQLLEASIVEARAVDDQWCLADALGTLGSIMPLVGELDLAERLSGEALAIARAGRDDQGIRMALFGIALAADRTGDPMTVRDAGEEGLEVCRSIGDAWFIAYFLWLLSLAATRLGDIPRAQGEAAESLALARSLEAPLLIVCALEATAAAARASGDRETAREALEEACRTARDGAVPGAYLASVTRGLAEILGEAGRVVEAVELVEAAIQNAGGVGDAWGAARGREILDRLQAGSGT